MLPLLRALGWGALVSVCLTAAATAAQSQQTTQDIVPGDVSSETHRQTVSRINGGTVSIISGGIGGTYIRIATDLASVLDDGDELRILPIMGKGSVQNIIDILYLRGIDIGIVQSDVLSYMKQRPEFRAIADRIRYITKLYNEEFHIVASAKIASVQDLAGKKVNFGVKGSGTFMTATTVFQALKIEVEPVHFDQELAIEKIKSGEIAATVYVAGKPARAVASLKKEDGLRLIAVPYGEALQETYLPAVFDPKDYPGLVPEAAPVETIAVGAVMAVFNWRAGSTRYQRVAKFVEAFFAKTEEFRKPPRHAKWQEVNLAATLPGWTRFAAAEDWLKSHDLQAEGAAREEFDRFVRQHSADVAGNPLTQSQQEALFRAFVRWKQSQQ